MDFFALKCYNMGRKKECDMKKAISGAALLIGGALVFLAACIGGGFGLPYINGWDPAIGRFFTAMDEMRLIPVFTIGIVAMVLGLCLIIWANFSHKAD